MGNSRQGQHQTTKTASSAKTASKQEATMLREEPQELLSNQALGKILQAQRQSSPHKSSTPMSGSQVKRSSGFRGLSQDLARSSSQGLVVQPKLKLTKAGDRHEQEADRVAAQVVKRINTDPIRKTEATKGDRLMPKAAAPTSAPTGTAVTPQFETTLQQQRGQGQSIPEDVREPLEEAFNADFRNVRIHTNERSQQLNHSIQAIAFTTGTDIFFKQGAYQPRSRHGQELLAHELTHVVQQNSQKTAIQRKGAGQIQFINEPFPEIAIFVQEVTQEIRSFSDTWLNSPPSEVEIFPWFKIVNPSIKMEQTTNNCSLDIQGRAELNFSSDLGNIQPKGSFKINYQSQTKKWDYKSENIDLEVTLAEIFHFKADDLQYNRADKALNIKQANLLIPQLNKATATVEKAVIDSNGLDWEKVTLNATEIKLGEYAKINAVSATIGGAKQQYASEFKGNFDANLGTDNLVEVKAEGQLTVKYGKGKWSCPDNNVNLVGKIAKVLEFNASNIQYDHENTRLSIGEAGIKIPDLYNANATVEKAVIDSNGLDWEKVTLNATEIKLGEYAKINAVSATIGGAKQQYASEFKGNFDANLGTDNLVEVKAEGQLTVKYEKGKWSCPDNNVNLGGKIAKVLEFNASNIQYDHENTRLSIGEAGIKIPDLYNANATVEKAVIDSNGLDWEKVTLNATEIKLGEYAKINAVSATIGGAKQQYASEFKGNFDANLGTDNLVEVKAEGQLTVKYEKGKWSCPDNNVNLGGKIAKVLEFNASNIQYDHENTRLSIGEAGIKIPDLYNANATVEKARIDSNGLDWEKVTLNATEIKLGEYAKINAVSATIGGAKQQYASEFKGNFDANLGTDNLVEVKAEGQLTVKYEKGKWSCPDNNVNLGGKIAKVLEFNASNIQYDHENKRVSIGEAGIKIPDLYNANATVEKAVIDSNGLDWEKVTLNATEIKLGEYAKINAVSATIGGAKQQYASEFKGNFDANLGTDNLVEVKAEGQLTVKYEKGKWSCPDNNVNLVGKIAKVLEFNASNIQYDHENTRLSIGEAGIKIPDLYNANATVEKARIDSNGLDWEKVTLNATEIKLGEYAKINAVSATIGGAKQQYASEFKGNFDANLGTDNLVEVKAEGQLTVKYEKGKWSCPDNNVNLGGKIAKVLEFNASNIQYDHENTRLSIGEAGIKIPDLYNANATVEKAVIDSNGLDWEKVTLNATEIKLGEYAKINAVSATIGGAKQQYASEFKGNFDANLGTDNLVEVKAEGQLTVKYEKGKWSCPDNNVNLGGKIAKVLEFNASNIQYDHENTRLSIGEAGIKIPDLYNANATVEKARIDSNGLDWEKVTLNATEIKLGEYAKINAVSATIGGAKQQYASEFKGNFDANLGTDNLVEVKAEGQLTVKYGKGKWSCPDNNVNLVGKIAKVLEFNASNIQYDHENTRLSIGEAGIKIPDLYNANATVEKARIDSNGLDWEKVTLNATEIKLGEYAKINAVSATIGGAKQQYASEFKGNFDANLGTDNLVEVKAEGQLTVKYGKGKWSCPDNNVNLVGKIAKVLEFNASNIQYDHENTRLSIGEAGIKIPDLYNANATVEKAVIDSNGLDWEKVTLNATEIKLGEYAKINAVSATIGGAKQQYASEFKGNFDANLGTDNLVEVKAEGQLTVKYEKGKWSCPDNNVNLGGKIAKVLEFNASNIQYDHENTRLSIGEAGIKIPDLYNANATVEKARIDSNGLDWEKVKLSVTDIALGQYANINAVSATIGGAKQDYASEFSGALGVNLGTSNLAEVNAKGQLTIKNVKGQWSCPDNSVSLKGTIADVLDFDASKIQYHHADKKVTIGQASVTIQQLNDTKASVDNARIDRNGLDWDAIKAQTGDISLGTVLSIKKPALIVEGAMSRYSTTVSGGVELHFGKYLSAGGSGKIKLDRSQGSGKGKIRVEEAKLEAKGDITFPGDFFTWPNISFDYPIVPGVEAGLQLGIKGGIGASLKGAIAKQAAQDWNLGVNPEIHGSLGVDLKAKVGVGSAYIAAIQAFVSGGCDAAFNGGLELNGLLKYDEETQKVDASKLTSEYYANAEFKASISAGVQAQALYFFTKDLYRIRAKCSLGAGKLEGKLEFDENGKFHIGKPKFSGVIAGEFDKTSIKLEEQSYELIEGATANAILEDAAQKIAGSGEKRKEIINKVKAGYIRSLDEAKKVINKETEKSEKYIKNLEKIDIKIARYNELIKLAKDLEQEEDSLNSKEVELAKELENEETKLNELLETEVETLVNEDKTHKEKSEHKRGLLSKLKSAAKAVGEGKEILKDKLIPDGVRKKYHKLEDKYQEKKLKAKKAIEDKRNSMRVKYDDFKKEKKESFSSLKNKAIESFPKIADKAAKIQSKASTLTKKASNLKADIKESIKEKTLIKLTELGIKNSQSFVKRIGELTELQIKYSKKHELHSNFLSSAIEAKSKAEKVLEDVDAAIANLQQLEEGTSMNKLTEMTEQEKAFMNAKNELHQEKVSLEDDFMKQIDDIEKEVAAALG